jgi:hypothetical protein
LGQWSLARRGRASPRAFARLPLLVRFAKVRAKGVDLKVQRRPERRQLMTENELQGRAKGLDLELANRGGVLLREAAETDAKQAPESKTATRERRDAQPQ